MMTPPVTFAVACNDDRILEQNLLRSPDLATGSRHQVVVRRGFPSAAHAYNNVLTEAAHDVIVFAHQDIYLPGGWLGELHAALAQLEAANEPWAVLGCFGSRRDAHGGLGQVYTVGLGKHGRHLERPEPVESLDEIVLVVRRSSGLRFDPQLPSYHLYGTDLCLAARSRGFSSFAFQGFCVHNTNQLHELPRDYYRCYWYMRRKWKARLPVHTACLTISRFNTDLVRKRAEEFRHRILRTQSPPVARVTDPTALCAITD